MCRIFTTSGKSVHVAKTKISVQRTREGPELPLDLRREFGPYGGQITTYSNRVTDLANGGVMVVGVDRGPVIPLGSPKIDGKDIFEAVEEHITPPAPVMRGGATARGSRGFVGEQLAVVRSGDYDVSIAPTPEDLLRLSDQMGGAVTQNVVDMLLADELNTKIPQSFVVFKLAADVGEKKNNSFAFMHRLTPKNRLSIPLKHNGHDAPGMQFTTPEMVHHDATVQVFDTLVEQDQMLLAGMVQRPRSYYFGDCGDLEFRRKFTEAYRRPQDPVSLVYPPSILDTYDCNRMARNVDPVTA